MVRVPTLEQEDRRHLHRELLSAKRDRTRVTNRMKGLLANYGLTLELKRNVPAQLVALVRKLMVELWRFLETGVVPEGAELKTDVRIR